MSPGAKLVLGIVVVLLVIAAPLMLANSIERFGEGLMTMVETWTDGE